MRLPSKAKILSLWEAVRTSYWFVPTLMALGSVGLSFITLELDRITPAGVFGGHWLYTGSAEGARSLLSTIASSMIGLAGVTFSITIVAMTLASNQLGPRLLRNFMRDLGNQIVFGTFIGAFLFSLLILRQVHGESGPGAASTVPQISILVSVLFAAAGLGVLIYFIHHAAESIQAPRVIAAVGGDLRHEIDQMFSERIGERPREEAESRQRARAQIPENFRNEAAVIDAGDAGYVQRIEAKQLLQIAAECDVLIQIEHRPGQYVQSDTALIRVWPAARVDDDLTARLRNTFSLNAQRSLTQDVEFAIDQFVEIAVRSLSPGINDPFTAMQCIDWLGAGLSQLAGRAIPSPYRVDDAGRLRVIAYPVSFCNIADAALTQIRQHSVRSLAVMLRMLEALQRVAAHLQRDDDRACIREHAAIIHEQAESISTVPRDRRALADRYAALERLLAQSAQGVAAA